MNILDEYGQPFQTAPKPEPKRITVFLLVWCVFLGLLGGLITGTVVERYTKHAAASNSGFTAMMPEQPDIPVVTNHLGDPMETPKPIVCTLQQENGRTFHGLCFYYMKTLKEGYQAPPPYDF